MKLNLRINSTLKKVFAVIVVKYDMGCQNWIFLKDNPALLWIQQEVV